MKTKTYLSLFICCFLGKAIYGQMKEFKFGKIDKSDISLTACPIDPNADAYMLGDFGTSYFAYFQQEGFKAIYERHYRIKIIKKTALGLANIEIPLYLLPSGKGKETLELKGNTYNLESGKMVVSKLDKSSIVDEKINRDWINKKIAMPDVKEGSVIEISYTITSDFYDLRGWKFQYNIPVVYSQYVTKIPEYFKYKEFQTGFESVKKTTTKETSAVDITWTSHREFSMVSNEISQTYRFDTYITSYIGENLKSFKTEPYVSAQKNYIASLNFVLLSLHIPNSEEKNYESTWESITANLLRYDDFGAIIKNKDATTNIVETSSSESQQSINRAKAIYQYIRDHFRWNGNDSLFASKGIKEILEVKYGNAADINLLLVNALKNAGFKADAVVLSTRDNGKILMDSPILRKLNYVIALVETEGKKYLLDATDSKAPFGFLPDKCLNGQGRIISEENAGNIDLNSNQIYQKVVSTDVKINANGELTGVWEEMLAGYAAHNFRNEVAKDKGVDKYLSDLQKKHPGFVIQHDKLENLDSLGNNINIRYDIALTGFTESKGNLLMIHPLLLEQMQVNPFTIDDRKYPVDYIYPYSLTYTVRFDMSEGFQIESLPKSQSLALPDKNIMFVFNAVVQGNKIEVTRGLTIQKPLLQPNEYKELKELYDQMVTKESEYIVLKKL